MIEWFNLNVMTVGGVTVIIIELLYVIVLYATQKSGDVAWYLIITDAGITIFLYAVINTIRYQYTYHSDITRERVMNLNNQLNASVGVPEEITRGMDGVRWNQFVERIGCLESLGVWVAQTVLAYTISQLVNILFIVVIFQTIQNSTTVTIA